MSRGGSPNGQGREDGKGRYSCFSNGSYVCWGLGEEDALAFKTQVIDRALGMQVAPLREAEDEELEFVVDPSEFVLSRTSGLCRNLFATSIGKLVFKGI